MSLCERGHGANPEKLYRAMGVPMPDPDKIIDFSTNTNVLPWEGWDGLKLDLRRSLASYPDDEATELRRVVAEREACAVKNCSVENVLVVNGSNEAIYLIASFLTGKRAIVRQPVYGEYRRALSAFGAEVRDAFETNVFETDVGDAEAFFLCNPCNPTGEYLESTVLEGLFERHPRTLFVVDEAYVDFLTVTRRKLDFLRWRNVVVLRSLTKIFHLCGARVGYVLACEERIARLKTRQPTWSVNAVAQAVAPDFMRDGDFMRRTRDFYAAETPRFIAELEKAGFRVLPTRTNFFLVEVADDQGTIRALLERGLVVRHTRNFPGLDGRYIRVATRTPEENDLLVQ
ncbi:MAG: pyridoxal phosphate-dependent class II aminotransferase, partial [Synergistaceae bacterium]|nr:pyridoxal phosphate-dependent class II aminotransferase [Synergistaceae bacterium]